MFPMAYGFHIFCLTVIIYFVGYSEATLALEPFCDVNPNQFHAWVIKYLPIETLSISQTGKGKSQRQMKTGSVHSAIATTTLQGTGKLKGDSYPAMYYFQRLYYLLERVGQLPDSLHLPTSLLIADHVSNTIFSKIFTDILLKMLWAENGETEL